MVPNVQAAREVLAGQEIDLCLIDLTLPDGSGYEVCRLAKEKGDIPVVFLTACDDEVNVVMGLDMGADDYVTKPFRLRELMSRIKSVLRRYGKAGASSPVLTFGNLRINTMEAKVYKEDEEVFLTALEYRLLFDLCRSCRTGAFPQPAVGRHLGRGGGFCQRQHPDGLYQAPSGKIEDNLRTPCRIITVRGLGYKWKGRETNDPKQGNQAFCHRFAFIGMEGTLLAWGIAPLAGIVMALTCLLLLAAAGIFTAWRYREITRLSEYLQRVCSGQSTLDIRDSAEGELSILKNDIYKMTCMLLGKDGAASKGQNDTLPTPFLDISHQLKNTADLMMVMTDLLSEQNLSRKNGRSLLKTSAGSWSGSSGW